MSDVKMIEQVTTDRSKSPRGDWYDWCRLLSNDTLEFGNEQGNYAGGATLSYRWYGDIHLGKRDEDHVPTDEYWDEVVSVMRWWKERNRKYYDAIIDMIKRNNSKIMNLIEGRGVKA